MTDYHDSAESDKEEIQNKKRIFIIIISVIGLLLLAITTITIIWSMVAVYSKVRNQETRMSAYRFERPGAPKRKSNLAATTADTKIQAILYVLSFFITYIFPISLYVIFEMILKVKTPVIGQILQAIFGPLQGFWNFLIYIRPRFNLMTKDHPEKSFFKRLCMTVLAKAGGRRNGKKNRGRSSKKKTGKTSGRSSKKTGSTSERSSKKTAERKSEKNLLLTENGADGCYSDTNLALHPIPPLCEEEFVNSCSDIAIHFSRTNNNNDVIEYYGERGRSECDSDDISTKDEEIGALSKLVAQDFFASSISSSTPPSRRRSMIDFTSTSLVDRNRNKGLQDDDDDDDYDDDYNGVIDTINEEDDDCDNKSGCYNLSMKISTQQRRRSCPSLEFMWKDSKQTETFRRALKEQEDEEGVVSESVLDSFVCSNSDQLSVQHVDEMNDIILHDRIP